MSQPASCFLGAWSFGTTPEQWAPAVEAGVIIGGASGTVQGQILGGAAGYGGGLLEECLRHARQILSQPRRATGSRMDLHQAVRPSLHLLDHAAHHDRTPVVGAASKSGAQAYRKSPGLGPLGPRGAW